MAAIDVGKILAHRTEMRRPPISENSIHGEDVVTHGAVTQRTATARIVSSHPPDSRSPSRGYIERNPEAVWSKMTVEFVENNTGLDDATAIFDIEGENVIQIFRAVDDEGLVDCLPGLRCTATTGQDAYTVTGRDGNCIASLL